MFPVPPGWWKDENCLLLLIDLPAFPAAQEDIWTCWLEKGGEEGRVEISDCKTLRWVIVRHSRVEAMNETTFIGHIMA